MVNEWTRVDLPSADEARGVFMETPFGASGFEAMLDAVVAHLNANGGLPADRDRWRRAHAIVEAERDTARESLRESCRLARSLNVEAHQATKRAESAERERDAARDDERLHSWGRITRHPFFDSIQFASGELTDAMLAALDEAHQPAPAEARTAPAVTRDEVAGKLRQALNVFSTSDAHLLLIADNVLTLFGVEAEPDPVETKAEELFKIANPTLEWAWASVPNEEAYRRMAAHVLGRRPSDE